MKSQRGITLISLTIYVLVMVIVVAMITTISSFFYSNVTQVNEGGNNASEFSKFNMFFLEETKTKQNYANEVGENGEYIKFNNGNKYTFQDNSIYKNNIKICENVIEAKFKYDYVGSKQIVTVFLKIGENSEFSKTVEYVMEK